MREYLSFTGICIAFLMFLYVGFYWMVHETDETLTKMDKDINSLIEKAAEEARIEKEKVLKKGKKLDGFYRNTGCYRWWNLYDVWSYTRSNN